MIYLFIGAYDLLGFSVLFMFVLWFDSLFLLFIATTIPWSVFILYVGASDFLNQAFGFKAFFG
jgi:hypothetical protein